MSTKGTITLSTLTAIGNAIRSKLGVATTYKPSQMAAAIMSIASTLGTKNISSNGTYTASSDSVDGYSSVTVSVPNSYAAADEGKVVSSGALVAQTSKSITANGTYDTTTNNEVVVSVSGGSANITQGTTSPSDGYGSDGEYYYEGEYESSTKAFKGSFTGTSTQTMAGWEFTANTNASVSGMSGIARSNVTGSLVLADGSGNEIAKLENVSFTANTEVSAYFETPVQLTSGSTYIVQIHVPSGGVKYAQSNLTFDSTITYVSGRYGGLPGNAEIITVYSVNVLFQGDGLFRASKQYHKSNGTWKQIA